MDQTRTVGLVTLPGALVGVLLGNWDPMQAAAAQVLIGLLAAEGLAVVLTPSGIVARSPADNRPLTRHRDDEGRGVARLRRSLG